MHKILIVGAGQSGLQLALSLPRDRYDVTVMSARTPKEIHDGRVMSTQVMFGPTLQLERDLGLNLWQTETPAITGLNVTVAGPSGAADLNFSADFDAHAQSVDQRLKMAAWLEMFTARGGKVIDHHVMTSELEDLTKLYDLTIIAAGKGELVDLFDRDPDRSPFDRPQRRLSVIYVHDMAPRTGGKGEQVGITVIPGVGELFMIPALTVGGRCDIIFWEAVPGGPLDQWDTRLQPADHLEVALELMREYAPEEFDRCTDVRPTDARCNLVGGYPPTVRHPIGQLSPRSHVLGMADVVVANDPIAGQGSNSAARCADIYHHAILNHGDKPFDQAWMQRTFDAFWDYAQHPTTFSNALLGPLPEHAQRILGAAANNPTVAARFAGGYADPTDFQHWFTDPALADAYLRSVD